MAIFRIQLAALFLPVFAQAQEKITYDEHVFPLFQQSCLNCHNPDKTKGGLDLSTYSGAMKGGSGGKIAEPGDVSSKLIAVCLQTVEPKMPPEGEKLGGAQMAILKGWIEGGLLENKNSSAKKPSKPKFESALKSDPGAKPDGPPPMPEHLLLEPAVTTSRASSVHALVASPWAPLLALTGQRQVLLHDSNTLELVAVLPFPEGDPVSLAFTPDGRYLIVGGGIPGKSGVTVTFDIRNGDRALTVGKEFDAILAADIRPGFDVVATGGSSKLLKLWNSQTGEAIASIKKHTDWITAVDISPDGILVASGDRNGGVWVWEAGTGNEFHTLRAHQAGITGLAFRADSNLLATASEDGTVRYWEMNGGSEVRKNDAHPGGVTALAFARDGSTITAGRDKKVRLWKPDFSPGRELAKDLPALPTAVALNAEGTRAFVADYQGTIRAYETGEGKPVGEFNAAPPTIGIRLVAIRGEMEAKEAQIAASEKKLSDSTARFEEAKKALAVAEETSRQARAIHEAAKQGEAEMRQKMELLKKTIADRRAALDAFVTAQAKTGGQQEEIRQFVATQPEGQQNPADATALESKDRQVAEQLAKLKNELAAAETEAGSLTGTLEGSARAAASAAERIKPADEAIVSKREAVPVAEKSFNEAKAEAEALRSGLPSLQAAEKHWLAANLNTRALDIREHTRQLSQVLEDEQAALRDAEAVWEAEKATLEPKLAERAAFAAKLADPASAPHLDEMLVTLVGLDQAIALRVESIGKGELKLSELRLSIETSTRRLLASSLDTDDLKAAYLSALRK